MTTAVKRQLGCGVGLRAQHYERILSEWPTMDWFEAISENYMDSGGRPLKVLEAVRAHYPLALHGVSLSIGSKDELDRNYLKRLKALVERVEPAIVSDHLCWSGVEGESLHDLLPLPFTEEAIRLVADHVGEVQDFIGRRILLENVSTYLTYKHSVLPEWEFLTEVAKRSGCGILLDLNNIYVNAFNHEFNAREYLRHIPGELVGQFHLAGHTKKDGFLFDTHSSSVIDPVWELYREALKLYGPVSTLVEWDAEIPEWPVLAEEAAKARVVYSSIRRGPATRLRPRESLSVTSNITRGFVRQRLDAPCESLPSSSAAAPINISLIEVQRLMKSSIQPNGDEEAVTRLAPFLNSQRGVPGKERISTYASGYLARITEALEEIYEAVKFVLGKEAFTQLAETYASHYHSHDYNLSLAGRHLPEHLTHSSFAEKLPFLSDLAKLEWQISQSFHAFEAPPFDPSPLAGLSAEELESLRFSFQPSVSVVSSRWPVLDIWKARKNPIKELNVDLIGHPQDVLVFRKSTEVHCESIPTQQTQLLQGLLAGHALGEVCEKLTESAEEAPPLSDWFSGWAANGLFSKGSRELLTK